MRYLKMLAFALLPLVMLALGACGGSGGSTTADPFSRSTDTGTNTTPPPQFNNISTTTGKITVSLTTDKPTIDVNNGQVLAIATVKAGETPVVGIPVTFSILAPTNLASIETSTVTTDSTGTAVTRITTGNTASTTNVLISASVTAGGQTVATNATFQLVRGGGVIMFTSSAGQAPGGQSNLLPNREASVPPNTGLWRFYELIPFKVTDSNGNPRVGVPVTLSVYSITTKNPGDATIDFLVNPVTEPNQQTITTDSAGQGIFNTAVDIMAPGPDGRTVVSIVYKAVTNDTPPVIAYLGIQYSLLAKEVKTTTP